MHAKLGAGILHPRGQAVACVHTIVVAQVLLHVAVVSLTQCGVQNPISAASLDNLDMPVVRQVLVHGLAVKRCSCVMMQGRGPGIGVGV